MDRSYTASSPTDLARALMLAQGPSVVCVGLLLLAAADPIGSSLGLDGGLIVAIIGAIFVLFGGGLFWRGLRPVLRLEAHEVSVPGATKHREVTRQLFGGSRSESEAGSAQRRLTHELITDLVPFADLIGVELISAVPEQVKGRLAWSPERSNADGVLHGGALVALADTMGGVCALLNLPPGATTSIIDTKTNFFGALRDGHVETVSRPLHLGPSIIVVQTNLFDAGGRRVAQSTQTQMVLGGSRG